MIKRDLMKSNKHKSLKIKENKDFDIMLSCIATIATFKRVNVKVMTSEDIINFTRKYSDEINEEYKRTLEINNLRQAVMQDKKKNW